MSKYLKSGTAARHTDSGTPRSNAYSSTNREHLTASSQYSTLLTPDPQRQSSAPENDVVQVRHRQAGASTEYTGSDHQQFDDLSEFPVLKNKYQGNTQRTWASCQFTEQDNVGFQHIMQDLNAVADISR